MNVDLPDLVTAKYFDALVEALEIQADKRGTVETVRQALGADCGFDILMSLSQIQSHHNEILIVLSGFDGRTLGLVKALMVEELILSIKFYVISWATLVDMLSGLINKAFNLGLADIDVKFDRILRNKHVLNSDLPAIFEKHSKALDMKAVKHHRNEIVHRGKIVDKEVNDFWDAQNVLRAKRYSLLRSNHISEEEYKKESAGQTEILFELASRKKATYKAHYKATLEMIAEVLSSLGRKAVELQKPKTI